MPGLRGRREVAPFDSARGKPPSIVSGDVDATMPDALLDDVNRWKKRLGISDVID